MNFDVEYVYFYSWNEFRGEIRAKRKEIIAKYDGLLTLFFGLSSAFLKGFLALAHRYAQVTFTMHEHFYVRPWNSQGW